jgi:hypothetical protein
MCENLSKVDGFDEKKTDSLNDVIEFLKKNLVNGDEVTEIKLKKVRELEEGEQSFTIVIEGRSEFC